MRPRAFRSVTPLEYRERRVGDCLVSVERYRGFFAEAHTHDEWQIQVPLKGRIHVTIGDVRQLAGPESVILMPPHVSHAALYLDGELDLFNVMVPAAWIALAAPAGLALVAPNPTARVLTDPFIRALATHMVSELTPARLGSDRVLALGVEQLTVALLRAYQAPYPIPSPDGLVLQAVEVILRDFWQDLSISGLAKEAGVTPRHFDRLFKAAIGLPPKQFLTDTRLRVARDLLENTDLPVTRIALDVGFRQSSNFVRTFHRVVGVPPMAYRQQHRRS